MHCSCMTDTCCVGTGRARSCTPDNTGGRVAAFVGDSHSWRRTSNHSAIAQCLPSIEHRSLARLTGNLGRSNCSACVPTFLNTLGTAVALAGTAQQGDCVVFTTPAGALLRTKLGSTVPLTGTVTDSELECAH